LRAERSVAHRAHVGSRHVVTEAGKNRLEALESLPILQVCVTPTGEVRAIGLCTLG
jgi:hypothetical protein